VLVAGWIVALGLSPAVTAAGATSCSTDPKQNLEVIYQTSFVDYLGETVYVRLDYSPVCRTTWAVALGGERLNPDQNGGGGFVFIHNMDTGATRTSELGGTYRVVTGAINDAGTQSQACGADRVGDIACTGLW
jgi:hypothetical protein